MADRKNTTRHAALAESVALTLRLHGLDDARPTPRTPRRRISDAFAPDAEERTPRPDVDSLGDDWHVDVTSADPMRWGPALDSVRMSAGIAGAGRGVLVAYRQARAISEAYAIMTLADLAEIIAEAERRTAA